MRELGTGIRRLARRGLAHIVGFALGALEPIVGLCARPLRDLVGGLVGALQRPLVSSLTCSSACLIADWGDEEISSSAIAWLTSST